MDKYAVWAELKGADGKKRLFHCGSTASLTHLAALADKLVCEALPLAQSLIGDGCQITFKVKRKINSKMDIKSVRAAVSDGLFTLCEGVMVGGQCTAIAPLIKGRPIDREMCSSATIKIIEDGRFDDNSGDCPIVDFEFCGVCGLLVPISIGVRPPP